MADINAVADPILDAQVFDMTNSITAGKYDDAARVLGELLRMQTEPIVILAAVGKELRRLYTARMALDGGKKGPALAEAAVEHEQRLPGQAPDAGGQKGGPRLVPDGGAAVPAAGPADEEHEYAG